MTSGGLKTMKRVTCPGGAIAVVALASTGVLMSEVSLSQAVRSKEPAYSVISPLGENTVPMVQMARRLHTLSNQTVCMVSNNAFKVNVTMPAIAKALQERYPGLKVVPYTEMPSAFSG